VRRAAAAVALVAALLTGLGCLGKPAPRTRYWRLSAALPTPLPAPRLDGVVQVDRPGAPRMLQLRPVLTSDATRPHALAQYDYHAWTAAPPELVQRTLADHLRAARVARHVVTPEVRARADWVVAGRLRRFERVEGPEGPRVAVELDLSLRRASDGALLVEESYRAETPAAGPGVDEAVVSLSEATRGVYDQFVADVARVGDAAPGSSAAADAAPSERGPSDAGSAPAPGPAGGLPAAAAP